MGDVGHFMSPLMCKTFRYCSLYCYISSEWHDSLLYSCHDVLIMELKTFFIFLEWAWKYWPIMTWLRKCLVKEVYRHILTITDFCAISSSYVCPGLSHFGMFDKTSMLRVMRDATRRTMSPRSFTRSSGPGRNETGPSWRPVSALHRGCWWTRPYDGQQTSLPTCAYDWSCQCPKIVTATIRMENHSLVYGKYYVIKYNRNIYMSISIVTYTTGICI